ncbi:phytoene desaturase family protein [Plebeiibacterium marinum]|uniref:NAD(P)/FAD-dependent oxidoreductase n=1 Tax=Plebeiibacterium marinum TaxID=2992111 RepID=A0AAE3MDQ5_9BACT|nr:NAD(P)/FAD-dependent oxidoreductase [Plebeiobacterium marinum]MCW3806058.1 NAD(P)/FAD-dependent oxidoreductase [Plebeiobacterium marinum]
MARYDIVVVGSGLAGLQCAYLLSKEGYNVCVVDKNDRIGGMMQSFARDGVVFNTGLNYTESLGDGEVLNRYFKLFGLIGNISLKQLDQDQSDIISLGDKEYSIPQGHEAYIEKLSSYFPKEAEGIQKYVNKLSEVCNSFPLYKLEDKYTGFAMDSPYMEQSASGFINEMVSDPDLRGLLAGTNILYAGQRDITPLYTHSLISYSFIKSSWRVQEGGSGIANVLANGVRANGGSVIRNAEVTKVKVEEGRVSGLQLANGEIIEGKEYISSLHPKTLIPLVEEGGLKKVFKKRIQSLEDSIGMFSVYIVLKKGAVKYQNYNHHYFKSNNVWTTETKDWPENFLLYTQYNKKTGEYADGLTIITYMNYKEVERWSNTHIEQRGDDYLNFKEEKAQQLIDMAEKKIPGLRNHIQSYYTSTPLTYKDYTGTANGSAYGLIKNYRNPSYSIVVPKTRLKNLYFTGQNLNMHGILGVSISSVLTCSSLLGEEYLYNKLINV